MDTAPGWRRDPEQDDLERYWSGSAWTDRVRPAGKAGSLRAPGHLPELQRALSAAIVDIDAVEDRLSTLFDRTEPAGTSHTAGTQRPSPPPAPADDDDIELFDESDLAEAVDDETIDGAVGGPADQGDDVDTEDDTFAELDAALATEETDDPQESGSPEPAQSKRGLFRRRR